MAHKKAGGSTRNGRDSESKRLGVRNMVGKLSELETFSFGKGVLSSILESMSVAVKIILCLLPQMAWWSFL